MMNKAIQTFLLNLYRLIVRTGLMSTPWGRRLFVGAYGIYKSRLEAPYVEVLCELIQPGTTVIDVGANVGYFTQRFSRSIGDGTVIAIEPERVNYESLEAMIRREKLAGRVEPIQAAVGAASGELKLEVDRFHPGNHRIGPGGVTVKAVSIDDLLSARSWPAVSLIKIDVQGAEALVIAGARETINRFHPALFVEIDNAALRHFDSSAHVLIATLMQAGYGICRLEKDAISEALTLEQARALQQSTDYCDFVFLPLK